MAVHRLTPSLPAEAMQTYAALTPSATHWRPATCAEVDCPNYLAGWRSLIDEATELGREQAHYIRFQSGRKFREYPADFGINAFVFEAGQECFAAHEVPLEREAVFVVRGGDWRGNPRGTPARVHQRPEDWVEDFAEHQDRLKQRLEGS